MFIKYFCATLICLDFNRTTTTTKWTMSIFVWTWWK